MSNLGDGKVDTSQDWAEIRADYGQSICFQQVEDYAAPVWPGETFRVLLDPAGHRFCLCSS
ncbi:MAG: hypothetical protein ABIN79_15315 [Marmoricola sp.]